MVSVLIISWNRKYDVLETIKFVFEQAYSNFEIIVVDNGSTDGTIDALRQAYPTVRLIELGRNIGIAARNMGVAVAQGEIIFCLDSDANPERCTIFNLVRKFQAKPKVGVINSKILNAFTHEIGKPSGWVYSERDKADQNIAFLSYSFSEGGCAIRKEVFNKVGPFWERLFFGNEGMELSLRVLDAGYDILYYPEAIIYHRVKGQSRIKGGDRDYLNFRNSLYIYLVRFPWWMFLIFAALKTGATLYRAAKRGYFRQILSGWMAFIKESPSLMKERKPIRNITAINYLKLQRQHGPLRWDLATWLKHKT